MKTNKQDEELVIGSTGEGPITVTPSHSGGLVKFSVGKNPPDNRQAIIDNYEKDNPNKKQTSMNTKEIIDIMESVSPYLNGSEEGIVSNLMYYTPAQSLRNAADAIEVKDAAVGRFKRLLQELKDLSEVEKLKE